VILDDKPKITDTVYFVFNGQEPDLDNLVKSDKLYNQLLITTHPALSFFTKISKDNIFYEFIKKYIYIDETKRVTKNQFGGIILYDFNIPQAIAYGGVEKFCLFLKKLNTQNIILIDSAKNVKFLASIEPIIVTDADIPLTSSRSSEYYRFKDFFSISNTLDSGLIKNYSNVGIKSSLSPDVDWDRIDSNFEKKMDTLIELYTKENFIPCLKHFCYDRSIGDTHKKPSYNSKSMTELITEDLRPYKYFSDHFPRPYLIMIGHHKINAFGSYNIASQSSIINDYVQANYKNAFTISDEITMRAFNQRKSKKILIENVKTDLILSHGGNIGNIRNELLLEISNLSKDDLNKRIKKVLVLKKYYNLLQIRKIN